MVKMIIIKYFCALIVESNVSTFFVWHSKEKRGK